MYYTCMQFSRSVDKAQLAGVMESVSSWTAGSEEISSEGGGASVIGPCLPGAVEREALIGPTLVCF